MIFWNFKYTSVVMFHALVSDTAARKEPVTLERFRDYMIKTWLKNNEKQSFKSRLKKSTFSKKAKALNNRISIMRNKIVAHRDSETLNPDKIIPGLNIPDLRSVYDEIEHLFKACTFGGEFITSLYSPGSHQGKPIQKDIDYIMELLLKNSPWLNQPERRGEFWQNERQYKKPRDIEELNRWRKKFDLPEA